MRQYEIGIAAEPGKAVAHGRSEILAALRGAQVDEGRSRRRIGCEDMPQVARLAASGRTEETRRALPGGQAADDRLGCDFQSAGKCRGLGFLQVDDDVRKVEFDDVRTRIIGTFLRSERDAPELAQHTVREGRKQQPPQRPDPDQKDVDVAQAQDLPCQRVVEDVRLNPFRPAIGHEQDAPEGQMNDHDRRNRQQKQESRTDQPRSPDGPDLVGQKAGQLGIPFP